jgi:hypothetical protein
VCGYLFISALSSMLLTSKGNGTLLLDRVIDAPVFRVVLAWKALEAER